MTYLAFQRNYHWVDNVFTGVLQCIRTLQKTPSHLPSDRLNPGSLYPEPHLSDLEKAKSSSLMRVNQSGEVCAQALYLGQSVFSRSIELRQTYQFAAKEESDHLSWCQARLTELNSQPSRLNPLWFAGSFLIGVTAGACGDGWSLGFLVETENQVYAHLGRHLQMLPINDTKSQAILSQMQQDEEKHAIMGTQLGAKELPSLIKAGMKITAKIMTSVSYYV